VRRFERSDVVIDLGRGEAVMSARERVPTEEYQVGDRVRAYIYDVRQEPRGPQIFLSRARPEFMAELFAQEVPEIYDGLITIKGIVREPGERAKVAVESYDDRIDPVGACVGMKGSRIHGIVRELRNENIDVINYTSNELLYIQRALSPAKISSIKLDEGNRKAQVFLKPDQVSLAIGKSGQNIKLASRLTGYEIDVFREMEHDDEDVDLDEFTDEIDEWIIAELKATGCDTAKSVLELTVDDLERRTDLDRETIAEVMEILRSEFED
jgi:N utilization substance protein A